MWIRYKEGEEDIVFPGLFLALLSIAIIIEYVYSLVLLFKDKDTEDIVIDAIFLLLMGIIDFFFATKRFDRKMKCIIAKKYFLFFFAGSFDLAGIVAIIVSIYSFFHDDNELILLCISIFFTFFVTLLTFLIYRKIEGYGPISIKLFTDKSLSQKIEQLSKEDEISSLKNIESQTNSENKFIYCRKCGEKLPKDSEFCSFCGAKLK